MNHKKTCIIKRILAPTPKWFRNIRTAGLVLASVGSLLLTSPIALPGAIVSLGGYMVLAGSIASAVSQTAVKIDNR